jgi:hypothetical protein
MKTASALALLLVTATSALPQGKIRFINDSRHLVYWSPDVSQLHTSDTALAGQVYMLGQGGQALTLELWAGSSSLVLSRVATTDFGGQGASGFFPGESVTLPIPGGTPVFFQILIYDSAAGSYATASSTVGHYFGQTPVFTAVPSTTIAYNSIVNHNSPVFSTWADGNYNMDLVSPDFRGAIMLQLHPTPIWISTQPSNQVVTVGQPASLVVLAGDLPTLSYQWYINGSALAGATDNAYTVASAHPSDAGTYYVVVTNSYGSVFSSDAVLQVLPTNAPSIQVNGQLAVGTVLSANPAQVTMSGGFAGGFIFYTVDGTTPSTTSPLYSGPVVLSNSATVRAISLSGDFSQSAEAPPIMVSLVPSYDLQTSVVGGGVITITPLGSPYVSNSVVTLVATAAANWVFDHWAGDASGNQDPLRLRMNGPKTVQAIFAATAYPLTVSTPGGGAVTVDGLVVPPGSYYPTGTVVTLSAAPNSGWNFLGWQGDSTGTNNPLVLTINQTNNIQAIFGTEVTTSVVGSGSILLNPPNPVPFGVASATGIPDPGNYLRVWSGAANGTNNTTTFFVTNATPAVGALFVTVPPGTCTLNVMVNGPGTVSVDPQKPYYSLGETVTLTAVATNANASFNGWAGDTGGTANPLTLTLDTNRVVIANFGSTPSVMITPPTQTVLVGSNAVLNAIGAGLPPLSYQWLRDFAPVTGATNTAYTIYNAQPTDGGPYRVRISNPYGSATSAVATVTVVTPPSIANQPSSSTVTAGTPLQLIVGAVGTSP